MKLQFSADQNYQLQAVQSVVAIFEGQPLAKSDFEVSLSDAGITASGQTRMEGTVFGVGNHLALDEEQILNNIRGIQTGNTLPLSENLEQCRYKVVEEDKVTKEKKITAEGAIPLNFTIEMETGTGKTYTYLRTIYELNKTYGFKKFIIVVPSVAIREGTIKNLQITHEHFQSYYDNPPINYVMYDRSNLTALRNFATSNAIQILVINIDSFTKDSNVINQERDGTNGAKLIEYLSATHPIVIIDEPQNFETDIRRAAIHNLAPLCTLRYSATHRNLYNLVYSLNPVQAYDLGLVKQIEVDGITSDGNYNAAFIRYKKTQQAKRSLKAVLTIYYNDGTGVKQKDVTAEPGDDLFQLSNKRDIYADGFILNEINAQEGIIEFANGTTLREGETQGGLTDEIMKFQIERTVKHHFDKLKKLKPQGIKVLSLFFIDKVANYREYDAGGNAGKGKFALWFEEAFAVLSAKQEYRGLIPFSTEQIHNGYFSSDKTGKGKDKKEVWTDTAGSTAKDDDTYSLIMKEKERLLGIEEPLQFIFSHSALREGWDNPNVFQICTLNESKTDLRKRQEIGRGLRLPVNSEGLRVADKNIAVLTVVANESYEDFSAALQREIQEETSVDFKGRVKNARNKEKIKLNKELTPENFPLFFEIWEKINRQTRYSVEYSTEKLISNSVEELKDDKKIPKTIRPKLRSETAGLVFGKNEKGETTGIDMALKEAKAKYITGTPYIIPDVYGYIQSRIDITRSTIYEILTQSGRCGELEINPQMFLDNVIAVIRRTLNTLLVEGVKYEMINGKRYEMTLFTGKELEIYLENMFRVSNTEKTLYNYIPVDSTIESNFAKDCETDENIRFFFKLPSGFRITTPIGDYIPDWAVVVQEDEKPKVYFVAETKGTTDWQQLRGFEKMKIECGIKHFSLFKNENVQYKLVVKAQDLY